MLGLEELKTLVLRLQTETNETRTNTEKILKILSNSEELFSEETGLDSNSGDMGFGVCKTDDDGDATGFNNQSRAKYFLLNDDQIERVDYTQRPTVSQLDNETSFVLFYETPTSVTTDNAEEDEKQMVIMSAMRLHYDCYPPGTYRQSIKKGDQLVEYCYVKFSKEQFFS